MNEEQNKHNQTNEETPNSAQGVEAVKPSSWKKLFAKRWVFPAMYLAAAAIILTVMWVYQGSVRKEATDLADLNGSLQDETVSPEDNGAVEVVADAETLSWPVKDPDAVTKLIPFYDSEASTESRQAAMIEYEDTFTPHVGLDLAREDNESFEVLAALSGTVSHVENIPVVGHIVEITHENGLKTIYQSLSDVKVKEGDEVKQGDVIAMAGRNELEKDAGVHLHFEVRENDVPVNPEKLLAQ
jgi:stage II sporulation protein Q